MIRYIDGDLLESPAKVIVNAVNTQGVMGKGIALRFKRIYPEMFERYREHCKSGRLTIGKLYLYRTPHKWVLNFPTKEHWRNPCRPEYIEAGLRKFSASRAETGIASIAFPQLGCGNGGLDFESQVKPLLEKHLDRLPIPALIHVGMNHAGPPERQDARRTREWLRSEPPALPFDEVWQDLQAVLRNRSDFRTRAKGTVFSVHVKNDPPALVAVSSGKAPARISSEELTGFWQQLRDHGLTYRGIAPNQCHLSYLMPVFEQLPYVGAAKVSTTTAGFARNPAAALQMIPPPARQVEATMNLFGNALDAAQAKC